MRKHSSKCLSSGKMISSAVVEVVRNYERTMNDFFYEIEINILCSTPDVNKVYHTQ